MSYSGNPTVKRFKTDMINFRNQLLGSFEDNITRQAEELMQNMRGAVPVDSGNLKRSIRRRNITAKYGNRHRVAVLVMAGGPLTTHRSGSGQIYDYALGVEFGTVDTKAEPFFYSSARRYQQAGRQSAAETLEKAIEENNQLRQQRSDHYSRQSALGVSTGGRGGAVFL
jgi:HK97 gp10 family phage protein